MWNVPPKDVERYRRMAQEFERACAEVRARSVQVRRSGAEVRLRTGKPEAFAGDPFALPARMISVSSALHGNWSSSCLHRLGVDYVMLDCSGFPKLTTRNAHPRIVTRIQR
jgi:hypothetical protein